MITAKGMYDLFILLLVFIGASVCLAYNNPFKVSLVYFS
jgi:hypothetical protein